MILTHVKSLLYIEHRKCITIVSVNINDILTITIIIILKHYDSNIHFV